MIDDPLKSARDEAFQKLGRNIVLFQHLELMLKHLIAESLFEGYGPKDAEARAKRRRREAAKSTLGTLVGRFKKEVVGTKAKETKLDDRKGWFRVRFGAESFLEKVSQLESLVDERNRLTHHLLEEFDLLTDNGIQRLSELLDPQADRIRVELSGLRAIGDSWKKARAEIGRRLSTEIDRLVEST